MKKAVLLALGGLAVMGAASSTAGASYAVSGAQRATPTCSPGSAPGRAVRITSSVKIGRGHPASAPLAGGMWVITGRDGSALVCLKLGSTSCNVGPDAVVLVLPRKPKKNPPLLRVARARAPISCRVSGAHDFATPAHALRLPKGGRALASEGDSAAARGGTVFSLTVTRRSTVVKMWRGAAVVSRLTTLRGAVVVTAAPKKPKQQVVARPRKNPSPPTALRATRQERRVFAQIERPLRRERDKTPPRVVLMGPRDPSSLRTAVFTFISSEPRTVFSCSLGGEDFRFCQSPKVVSVGPGPRTFRVKGTDPAGNSRIVTYSWTVDASRIAFASNRDDNVDIYSVESDGTNEMQLTEDPAADEAPEWSHDGTQIAFHRRGAGSDIFVMDADGTDERRITAIRATDRNPSWSPDGRRLAFESDRGGSLEIFVIDVSSGAVTRLTDTAGANFDPAWSPDGTRIAFASTRDDNQEVYVMNADGGEQKRLTTNPDADFNPAWSPDGAQLAFHSRRGGLPQHIYVMDATGEPALERTRGPANDHNPAWSPDGAAIVFQRELAAPAEPTPPMAIYYVLADGSRETRLFATPGTHYDPDW